MDRPLFTRRETGTLLLATAAAASSPPWPAKAQVDPITALQAAAAVASIIGFVVGLTSSAQMQASLTSINTKLDIVIRNQQRIIDEIQGLKVYIDQALFAAFRNAAVVKMKAHQDRLAILAVVPIGSTNRGDYKDLLGDVIQTSGELGQYGPAAYIAFGSGVGMALAISVLLGEPKAQVLQARITFRQKYLNWLDPNNEKGIVAIVKLTSDEIAARKNSLNVAAKEVVLSEDAGIADGGAACIFKVVLYVSGNFDSGFSGSTKEYVHDCQTQDFPRALTEDIKQAESSLFKSRRDLFGMDVPKSRFMFAATPVPAFSPSGFEYVDSLNRERIAIYSLMNVLAQQQVIQGQIQDAADALKV